MSLTDRDPEDRRNAFKKLLRSAMDESKMTEAKFAELLNRSPARIQQYKSDAMNDCLPTSDVILAGRAMTPLAESLMLEWGFAGIPIDASECDQTELVATCALALKEASEAVNAVAECAPGGFTPSELGNRIMPEMREAFRALGTLLAIVQRQTV